MYLFDACSIVNLVKRGVIRPFADGATLELALYESLNAIWKEHLLLKRIDRGAALLFLDVVSSVFNVIKLLTIKGLEKEVFNLASKENLTVYDASYLYVAMKNGFTLVTDDEELRGRASKYVRVTTSSELASKYKPQKP